MQCVEPRLTVRRVRSRVLGREKVAHSVLKCKLLEMHKSAKRKTQLDVSDVRDGKKTPGDVSPYSPGCPQIHHPPACAPSSCCEWYKRYHYT